MSENLRYWLWLQKALGEGAYIKKIIDEFGSAKGLYDANILEWRMSPCLTAKQVNKLEAADINAADEIIYNCRRNNWQIVDFEDDKYPERLKEIINPPAVLYVDGELPDIDSLVTIGIVGTRKASDYAVRVTHIMSMGAAEAGAVIVSGGALGVDSAAHRGALTALGKTVAVLGCGFGTSYLNENKSLRESIKASGALVTEYPPFTRASKTTFPMRNRIISGLSLGVLVVEAGVKSGSLITANFALEQGRDVYAVPASVLSADFAGTNRLIDDGAMVITKPVQLIASYAERFASLDASRVKSLEEYIGLTTDGGANIPEQAEPDFNPTSVQREKRLEAQKKSAGLSGDLKTVYSCLKDSFLHIDQITQDARLSVSKVTAAITQLEIMGLAESTGGKRYKKS